MIEILVLSINTTWYQIPYNYPLDWEFYFRFRNTLNKHS